jgi:hypothetical protein
MRTIHWTLHYRGGFDRGRSDSSARGICDLRACVRRACEEARPISLVLDLEDITREAGYRHEWVDLYLVPPVRALSSLAAVIVPWAPHGWVTAAVIDPRAQGYERATGGGDPPRPKKRPDPLAKPRGRR